MAKVLKSEILTDTNSWYNRLKALYEKKDSDGNAIVSQTINIPSSLTSATTASINDYITQLVYLYDNTYYNYANWTSKPTSVTRYSKILETLKTNITTTLTNVEKICANFSKQAVPNSAATDTETVNGTSTNQTTNYVGDSKSTNYVGDDKTTNNTSNSTYVNSTGANNTVTYGTCSKHNTSPVLNSKSGNMVDSTSNTTQTNTTNSINTTNGNVNVTFDLYCSTTSYTKSNSTTTYTQSDSTTTNQTSNSTTTTYSPNTPNSTGNATINVEYTVKGDGSTTSFGKYI